MDESINGGDGQWNKPERERKTTDAKKDDHLLLNPHYLGLHLFRSGPVSVVLITLSLLGLLSLKYEA